MQELLQKTRLTLRSMWLHRWWGLGTAVVVGLLAAGATFLIPDKHEATSRVYVDTQSILKPLMTGMTVQPNVEQQIAMMSRTLISRPNVERVTRMTDLDVSFKSPQDREGFLDHLMKDIEFRAIPGATNLYSITYRHPSPSVSKDVVQSLLSIFVESNLGDKRRDTDQARRFIEEQIKVYEQRLLASEEALKNFKIRNLEVMPNLAQDYVSRASELQNMATQSRLELRQAQYARDAIRGQLAGEQPTIDPGGDNGDERIASSLDGKIEAQRSLLTGLRTQYTDAHPDVIGNQRILDQMTQARTAEIKSKLNNPVARRAAQRANPVFQQLRLSLADAEAQVAALNARVADFQARLIEAREAAQTIPKVEAEYTQLTRDYDVNRKNYEQLLQRRESVQMSGDMEATAGVAEFRVIDPPRVSSRPIWPNRPLLLTLALMASIAAGLGAAFLGAQLRPTFFDLRSLREATQAPLLGIVSNIVDPAHKSRARRGALMFSGSTVLYLLLFLAALAYFAMKQSAR